MLHGLSLYQRHMVETAIQPTIAFSNETGKKAAKIVTPSLLRAHNAALRLHPSGLIALRASVSTLSLLSFFPFFLLEKCF
jgi:hypothetical protein